jgi:NAD(P)-dependent dehydrogenase (short-subunit alcohol dehydrogenase family)
MVHYGITKTALLAVSRGLAETVAGTGVTVNAVLPGPTASEGVEQFVKDLAESGKKTPEQVEQEFFANTRPTTLIKRFETVEEIANMCVFLASERASAVTGTAVRVDGGVVRSVF